MGAIQSAINQSITLGGLLYTQTGQYKAKQEEIAKNKEINTIEKEIGEKYKAALRTAQSVVAPNSKASPAEKQLAASSAKDLAEATEKAFKLNPVEWTKQRAIQTRGMSDITSGIAEGKLKIVPYDPQKAKQANMDVVKRVNAMSEQKQSVANYMKLLKEDDNG